MYVNKPWSEEEISLLREVYPTVKNEDIPKYFPNRTVRAVEQKAYMLKIKPSYNKKLYNRAVILIEETPLNYYWIGFLMADGHFQDKKHILLGLATKDLNHLEKFADYTNSKIKTYGVGRKFDNYKCQPYNRVAIYDSINVPILCEKFKIHSNKTYNPCDLSCLDIKEKIVAFFAGFFDGDGSTNFKPHRINTMKIQCHSAWLEQLTVLCKKLCESLNIHISKPHIDSDGYVTWNIATLQSIKIIHQEVKRLELPIMERKWDLQLMDS